MPSSDEPVDQNEIDCASVVLTRIHFCWSRLLISIRFGIFSFSSYAMAAYFQDIQFWTIVGIGVEVQHKVFSFGFVVSLL